MTKPTITLSWATNVLYTSGPFLGAPTKLVDPAGGTSGSVPGEGVVAQFYNYNMHLLGNYTQWVFQGTSDPDLTSHIVETDMDGNANIAACVIGDTASTEKALVVKANTGNSLVAIEVENLLGGQGISCVTDSLTSVYAQNAGDTLSPTVLGINTDVGPGVNGSAAIGVGVRGNTESGTAGRFLALTSGIGLDVDTTSGIGLDIDTTTGTGVTINTQGIGVLCSTSGGLGGNFTSSNITGVGVAGTIANAGSTTNSIAVQALNSGSGRGVFGQSTDGYGGQFENVNGTKAPINVVPKSGAPGTIAAGDVFFSSTHTTLGYGYSPANKRWIWGTPNGFASGYNQSYNTGFTVTSGDITQYQTGLTMALSSEGTPIQVGYIEINVNFAVISSDANFVGFRFQLWDLTANVSCFNYSGLNYLILKGNSQNEGATYISKTFRYLLPNDGGRVFQLRFGRDAVRDYNVSDQAMSALGLFNTVGG